MEKGIKYDKDKPIGRVLLEFNLALLEVMKVGTYGQKKYPGIDNWKKVEDAKDRYTDAAIRHMLESKNTLLDDESGLLHFAHFAWNALAVLQLIIMEERKENDNV